MGFDEKGRSASIEEKSEHPKNNYCVTGFYFYDNRVTEYAKSLQPSNRRELNVELLVRRFTWLDTGAHESLVETTNFVMSAEKHQHCKLPVWKISPIPTAGSPGRMCWKSMKL